MCAAVGLGRLEVLGRSAGSDPTWRVGGGPGSPRVHKESEVVMAKGKQITPSQGTSKTSQTSAPAPIPRPQSDRNNLVRTGAAIPKTDVIAESGWSAVKMVP